MRVEHDREPLLAGDTWTVLWADACEARRRLESEVSALLAACEPGFESRLPGLGTEEGARALLGYVGPGGPDGRRAQEEAIRRAGALLVRIDEMRRLFEQKARL
jgi:hypothetical protein